MSQNRVLSPHDLTVLAKRTRKQAGKTRAQAARDMKVSQTSIFHAEENPDQGLAKLRIRMIKKYGDYTIKGPVFILRS